MPTETETRTCPNCQVVFEPEVLESPLCGACQELDITLCAVCGKVMTEGEVDAYEDHCAACYAKVFFRCGGCGGYYSREEDEESDTRPGLCAGCGDAMDTKEDEKLEEDREEAKDAIDDIHDLVLMQKTLAIIKVLVQVD